MTLFLVLAACAVLAAIAYIRLAPFDPATWHIDLQSDRPESLRIPSLAPGADPVQTLTNGAYADLFANPDQAAAILAQLAQIAAATPRTSQVAGSLSSGHITWQTRTAFWGFPDYTTAQITPTGVTLYARLRFGRSDLGVNAARLHAWLSQLQAFILP